MIKNMHFRKLLILITLATPAWAGIVEDVRTVLAQNNFSAADSYLNSYRASKGVTPEYAEAYSWMARTALNAHEYDHAAAYAKQTSALVQDQLKQRPLDAEPHLPLALGAAIEVQAQTLAAQGQRTQAVAVLQTAGSKPPVLAQVKGAPVLLFFWAHWCGDCKAEAPIITQLRTEFAPKGLTVIGPTRLYGYTAQVEDAAPSDELAYIDAVRHRFYGGLLDMPVPISKYNFDVYGASTTPTLVLLDRAGKVAMYHPGALSYEQLKAEIEKAAR
jgi:thiol-disulfide isomerase/thioredoxin